MSFSLEQSTVLFRFLHFSLLPLFKMLLCLIKHNSKIAQSFNNCLIFAHLIIKHFFSSIIIVVYLLLQYNAIDYKVSTGIKYMVCKKTYFISLYSYWKTYIFFFKIFLNMNIYFKDTNLIKNQ